VTPNPTIHGLRKPAFIESARVVNVDAANYSVDILTDPPDQRYWGDMPFASPYMHHQGGEGVYAMPEVGARCWICWPSDALDPFVLAYGPYASAEDAAAHRWRGGREELRPGDIYMGTRDRNGIVIRRGGVLQVMSTPLAQRMYIPINNLIRDFCQNYGMHTFGGDLTWEVGSPAANAYGDKETVWKLRAKEKADDPGIVCELSLGHHDDDSALELLIYSDGTDEHTQVAHLTIDKAGVVTWTLEHSFGITTEKSFTVAAKETVEMVAKETMTLDGEQGVTLQSTSAGIRLLAKDDIELGDSGLVVKPDGRIEVGKGATEPIPMGNKLASWLSGHGHVLTGTVTGTAVSGQTTGLLPGTPDPTTVILSQKHTVN
jgi:hypothetical protein